MEEPTAGESAELVVGAMRLPHMHAVRSRRTGHPPPCRSLSVSLARCEDAMTPRCRNRRGEKLRRPAECCAAGPASCGLDTEGGRYLKYRPPPGHLPATGSILCGPDRRTEGVSLPRGLVWLTDPRPSCSAGRRLKTCSLCQDGGQPWRERDQADVPVPPALDAPPRPEAARVELARQPATQIAARRPLSHPRFRVGAPRRAAARRHQQPEAMRGGQFL